jgi:hypothetical protein
MATAITKTAVPKSGASRISSATTPTGQATRQIPRSRAPGRARRLDKKTTTAILASSEGWNCPTDGKMSQRRVPCLKGANRSANKSRPAAKARRATSARRIRSNGNRDTIRQDPMASAAQIPWRPICPGPNEKTQTSPNPVSSRAETNTFMASVSGVRGRKGSKRDQARFIAA